jgi:hypothetical protein
MKINYKGFIREKIQRNPVTISLGTSLFQAWGYSHVKGHFYVIKPLYDIPEQLLSFIKQFMIFSKS